jgi:hypothetical protein
MTSLTFHNDTTSINHLWYESHKNILANVCIQLGQSDKIEEMTSKLLGEKMKMRILKDPNKPKRPKSSYLFFCEEHRPALMKKMRKKGKINLGDIAKKLGAAWKNISEKEKDVFIKQSVNAKTEYEVAIEKYNSTL